MHITKGQICIKCAFHVNALIDRFTSRLTYFVTVGRIGQIVKYNLSTRVAQFISAAHTDWGPKIVYILSFRRFRYLMANIFEIKQAIDNGEKALQIEGIPYIVLKFL